MRLDLQADFAEEHVEWAEGFHVLEENRAQRGIILKYSLDYLHRLRPLFPGRVRMPLLRHESSVVAAALVVCYQACITWLPGATQDTSFRILP